MANWSKLANFNLANTCVPHATPLRIFMRMITRTALARVFGGINFGDLVKFAKLKSPQKFPAILVQHTINGKTVSLVYDKVTVSCTSLCLQLLPLLDSERK